jgi:hypothetical protein
VGQLYTEIITPVLDVFEGGVLLEVPCALPPRSVSTLWLPLGRGTVVRLDGTVADSSFHRLAEFSHGGPPGRFQATILLGGICEQDRAALKHRIAEDVPRKLEGEMGVCVPFKVLTLSQGGMMAELPFAPDVGTAVVCSIEWELGPARMGAIVRHAEFQGEDHDRPRSRAGFEFLGLGAPVRNWIAGLVARRLELDADA